VDEAMSLPAYEEPPVDGLVAGKYEIVRLIGRGGMGSVWEARHASLGTSFAIKFIDSEYAASTEARARFDTEARAAATIQSKHAIQIFDHGVTENGRPYIVMEMLTGEPLDRRVDRVRRVSLPDIARILQQVCRALQRAHDAGIIHRDLKPENIFLVRSPDDDDEVAKVLDFGIAKIKPPPGSAPVTSSTKTGAVMGTPYYMSPEQARGLRTVDHRSDLWSLGVIAFKCVTGTLPFEGEAVGDLLVKICTSPIPAPSQYDPTLPASFDAWFMRALEREPARRFSTATELAEGLAFAAGLSVRRGSLGTQGPPPSTAPPPVSSVPQPGSAALTAAPFVTSTPKPRRSSKSVYLAALVAGVLGLAIGIIAIAKVANSGSGSSGGSSPASVGPAATSAANTASPAESLTPLDPSTSTPTSQAGSLATTPLKPSASASAKPPPTGATAGAGASAGAGAGAGASAGAGAGASASAGAGAGASATTTTTTTTAPPTPSAKPTATGKRDPGPGY
jgi:serine/threonine-protein kinase